MEIFKNKEGRFHREGGLPSIIFDDGRKEYYKNGKCHREGDNPAIVDKEVLVWFKKDKRHRTCGPAIIWIDGTKEYWINGKRIVNPVVTKRLFFRQKNILKTR